MRVRRTTVVGAALVALLVGVVAGCAPDAGGRVTTVLAVPCAGDDGRTVAADWYLPPTGVEPAGLVWLQHGFVESKDDWRELGPVLAARGLVVVAPSLATFDPDGCNVEDLGGDGSYVDDLAAVVAAGTDPHGALARSYASARDLAGAGRHRARLPRRVVLVGHSAGGEAVLAMADGLRRSHPRAFARLGGVVLADPVGSFFGSRLGDALDGLAPTAVPILTLAAPDSACNAYQRSLPRLRQALAARPFLGVRITTGTHGDVFGSAVMPLEALVCGAPDPTNVAAVRDLTTAWVLDAATGTHDPRWYPGGSSYAALLDAGTITTLT